jgi:Ca2+-binding RTX toxin-like protein
VSALAATIVCRTDCRGTVGDDRISSSARANTIYAEKGNYRIVGHEGDDALKGDDGSDEVFGQEDGDRVKGSAGTDNMVYGGPGDDLAPGGTPERPNDGAQGVLDCGAGEDTVYFVPGQDEIRKL